ncbi:unnamed protein product [Nippostrongylus brasiliensis]|uniref:Small integral membrane protein 17 n=1 Tax=Nippostrongylus brasiliensis TaxID=27835 RepID=A0A0N4Y9J7_NIPBR|nr:unnamed protein product [Nippostrongylus brasiliensis]
MSQRHLSKEEANVPGRDKRQQQESSPQALKELSQNVSVSQEQLSRWEGSTMAGSEPFLKKKTPINQGWSPLGSNESDESDVEIVHMLRRERHREKKDLDSGNDNMSAYLKYIALPEVRAFS